MGVDPAEDKNHEDLIEVQEELRYFIKMIEEIHQDLSNFEVHRA